MFCTVVISPELVTSSRFMAIWSDTKFQKKIDRVCVDESHCVSLWGRDFRTSFLGLDRLHATIGENVPFFLTSATLRPEVREDVLRIIGLPFSTTVMQRSNNRPNIHLAVRPMKHTLKSCFDIVFLLPLDAKVDDKEWIEANISQFLVYCNSRNDTLRTARFLRARLPIEACNLVVWYHSGMSDTFKDAVVEAYEAGRIWGICCTDACSMVSNVARTSKALLTYLKGLDLRKVKIVVQYRVPKSTDTLVQRVGRAGRDPSINTIALLLAEKAYFSKVRVDKLEQEWSQSYT